MAGDGAPLTCDFRCLGQWDDGALERVSFQFKAWCEERWGQCFMDVMRRRGLTVGNWQCWQRSDGWWQVDVSTDRSKEGVAADAIHDATRYGQVWDRCWSNR
jgi:hypothetical protein